MQNFAAMQTSVGLLALIYFLIAIPKASAVAGGYGGQGVACHGALPSNPDHTPMLNTVRKSAVENIAKKAMDNLPLFCTENATGCASKAK
jgi:hypothetical protein